MFQLNGTDLTVYFLMQTVCAVACIIVPAFLCFLNMSLDSTLGLAKDFKMYQYHDTFW